MNMIKKTPIFSIIICFILFYNPPMISINTVIIGGLLSYIYIFINHRIINKKIDINKMLLFQCVFLLILTYLYFVNRYNSMKIENITFLIYIIAFVFPMALAVCLVFKKKNFNTESTFRLFLITGLLQSIVSLATLLYPNFQKIIITRIVSLGYSSVWLNLTGFRLYGYSDGLTYSMPVIQSFLAILSIYMFLNYNYRYIYFFPFLFLSGVINARTSIVIISIGIALILYEFRKKVFNNFLRTLIFIFVSISVFVLSKYMLESLFPEAYRWISRGVFEISMFFKGETSEGYFSYLLNEQNYILPDSLTKRLFGIGSRTSLDLGVYTDIGYINDIWLGGYIYIILFYSTIFIMSIYIRKKMRNEPIFKFTSSFFLLSSIFANFKGVIFGLNGLFCFIIILFVYTSVMGTDYKRR